MIVPVLYRIVCWGLAALMMGKGWAQQKQLGYQGFAGEERLASVTQSSIAPNGKYIAYTAAAAGKGIKLIILQVDGNQQYEFPGVTQWAFTRNSRHLLMALPGDTLGILDLPKATILKKAGIRTRQLPQEDNRHRLALITNDSLLILYNLATAATDTIYHGRDRISQLVVDPPGRQLAFIAGDVLYYYAAPMTVAKPWITKDSRGMQPGRQLTPGEATGFSNDGRRFFVGVNNVVPAPVNRTPQNVIIWHYKRDLPSLEAFNNQFSTGIGTTKVGDSTLVLLNHGEDALLQRPAGGEGEYALAVPRHQYREQSWRPGERLQLWLVNTNNGHRKQIATGYHRNNEYSISPAGRYVSWYDPEQQQYFVYSIHDSMVRCVTRGIPVPLANETSDHPGPPPPYGMAGWLPHDEGLILYDRFDGWQVDPAGAKLPVCITGAFGRKNGIILRLMDTPNDPNTSTPLPARQQPWLLTAFYTATKENGFYQLLPGEKQPRLLSKGPYIDYAITLNGRMGKKPVKAMDTQRYLVTRMSAQQSPNVYVTDDFSSFKQMSAYNPETQYDWLQARLIRYPLFGDNQGEAIMYCPQHLDTTKQYPVIVYCYERQADQLHVFREPGVSNGELDIPNYVSNGYVVLVPDIHYRMGQPGQSALECVEAAVSHIGQYAWIDTGRMALQGHSFGGYAVNYMITKSNRFKAACSAAGLADLVSGYNSLWLGESAQWVYETGQMRMGATLWQQHEAYVMASPVMAADSVHTPLLIVHNRNDVHVPFSQGIEWFTALRRLGKPAWMLEYKGEGHQLQQPANQLDLATRLKQFFDHYLKGLPAPAWMQ
ncbi:MAG: S9 family peptidase [Niastella sp.]|nr:S9 family peptidase [Niastella sp.]